MRGASAHMPCIDLCEHYVKYICPEIGSNCGVLLWVFAVHTFNDRRCLQAWGEHQSCAHIASHCVDGAPAQYAAPFCQDGLSSYIWQKE